MVVAVTDRSLLSLAGRVVMPLAIALVLLGSGTSAQPGRTGAPPGQLAAVHVTPQPHRMLGGQPPLVRAAARLGQRNRRDPDPTPDAILAAALAGAVVATTRPDRVPRPRRLDGPLLAPRPRAPPSRRA
jgi:hypothetical protein